MISLPSGPNVRVWIATGYTDMRCGFPSLALRVQEVLKLNPPDLGHGRSSLDPLCSGRPTTTIPGQLQNCTRLFNALLASISYGNEEV